jgi:hypothetical protein
MAGDESGPQPRSRSRVVHAAYIVTIVALVTLLTASIVFQRVGTVPRTGPPDMKGWYYLDTLFVSFVGGAAQRFYSNELYCDGPHICMAGPPGTGGQIEFDINLTRPYNCSTLGTFEVNQVTTSQFGAFVLTNVSAFNATSMTGFAPLPAKLPSGNHSLCNGYVQLFITLRIVPQGTYNQTLYVTVAVSEST